METMKPVNCKKCGKHRHHKKCPCPNPSGGIPFNPCYPCAECIVYDPTRPPPGWPNDLVPWAGRGDLPPETRCNLTPPLVNISAETAFDYYQNQSIDGVNHKVVMIDVRTPEEVYWVGIPAQVNSITMNTDQKIIPDNYKVILNPTCDSKAPSLKFEVNSNPVSILSSDVKTTNLTGISYNIPVEYINTVTGVKQNNPLFGKQVDALITALSPDRIIFFCRSGERSSIGCYYQFCPFEKLFPGVISGNIIAYEVEGPKGTGVGGFEGRTYNDVMIGYRGFPGRYTADFPPEESVSFKDMGLPIKTSTLPKSVCVQPVSGALLKIDKLDAAPWADTH